MRNPLTSVGKAGMRFPSRQLTPLDRPQHVLLVSRLRGAIKRQWDFAAVYTGLPVQKDARVPLQLMLDRAPHEFKGNNFKRPHEQAVGRFGFC